jgi:membrane fusion protein (multidrug efflux system)
VKRTLTLLLVTALACKPKAAEQNVAKTAAAAVKVSTARVEVTKVPKFLTLTGSVQADKQSEVAANVSGRITATLVERGSPVHQGQVIAVVDSRQAGLSASAAVAQYQAAETQVQLAQQECERADKLFAQAAIAQAEHDRLKTQCKGQLAQANAARANADIAGKLASDTIIRAPIDGTIGERYINVGEYVQPSTRVASIYAVNPVRVAISVPENAVSQILPKQELNVRVSAWGARRFPAVVEYISPALRSATRDLIVEAKAKNEDGSLKPGMFATVELAIGEEDRPVVPEKALRVEGAVKRLFLAKDKLAVEMVVRTGVSKDGHIALLDPLPAGTAVIVSPPPTLKDGEAIE